MTKLRYWPLSTSCKPLLARLISSPHEKEWGGWLFLPGDAMPQAELVLAICEGNQITPSFRRAGPHLRIPLKRVASRKGFARVSEMLGKEAPTDLQERIL